MNLKSILATVGKTAFPFIATAATAGNPLLGLAASAVGKAFGIDHVDPTPEGIDAVIAQAQIKDPEALLKLQQADHEFQEYMSKLGYDSIEKMAEVNAADRANARAREIAIKDRVPFILAMAVTFGFFGLLGLLAYHQIPSQSESIIFTMVGSLGTAWIGIVNYYFGSSAGSAKKTDLMAGKLDDK